MQDGLFESLKIIFDNTPQPVGVAKMILDDDGEVCDFEYFYLNSKLAEMSNEKVEDLQGCYAYEHWGDDDLSWLEHFSDAAFDNRSCEFETAAVLFERFLHVTVSPLVEGYCTFIIQDVSTFIDQDQYIEDDLSVGRFLLDLRTSNLMLSSPAQERYGFDKSYIAASRFAYDLFGSNGVEIAKRQISLLQRGKREILFEGRSTDGRWLRITANHIPQSDRFVSCIIKDITRAREAEERSAYRMSVIECLTRENFALYVVDLDDRSIEEYSGTGDLVGVGFVRSLVDTELGAQREAYLENFVSPDDRDMVDKTLNREALEAMFDIDDAEINITYRRLIDGEEQYVELRVIRLHTKSRTAVIAIRNMHSEMQEQMRQKTTLQKALELAQHASAAKSTFLTNMSHDFRTPMNSIVGFTGIALEHSDDTERMIDCLKKIRTSSDHLLRLINDVLDVSRIESGVVESDEAELDLLEFADGLDALFSGEAQGKNIDFTIDTSGVRRTKVMTDRQHLGQIFVNLVGNAFKFTQPGGSVEVLISEFHDTQKDYGSHVPAGYGRFEFVVRDTGCGMVPEFMDLLFVPFERNGLDEVNLTEGTGLGMPIAKNLVDLLGGTIEVESEVGKGSEFTVTLPLRLADAGGDAAAYDVVPGATDKDSIGLDGESAALGCRDLNLDKEALLECFGGKRLLIADDDDLSREILKEVLTGVGFVVDEFDNGKAAVDCALASDVGYYDAIIMDMRMPEMTGDVAARTLRDSGRTDMEQVPIIALTADAFEEGRRRSREAGMVAHITKPFKRAELMGLLAQHLV